MAIRRDLTGVDALREDNDEDIDVTLTTNKPDPGTVLNLTGKTMEAFLKPAVTTPDSDVSVWKGVSGAEITITDAGAGKASIAVPRTAVTTAKKVWRVDVISGGRKKTAMYGDVTVTDL